MKPLQFVTVLCLVVAANADGERQLLTDDRSKDGVEAKTDSSKIGVGPSDSWGYEDQTAYAGKLFEYRLNTEGVGDISQVRKELALFLTFCFGSSRVNEWSACCHLWNYSFSLKEVPPA